MRARPSGMGIATLLAILAAIPVLAFGVISGGTAPGASERANAMVTGTASLSDGVQSGVSSPGVGAQASGLELALAPSTPAVASAPFTAAPPSASIGAAPSTSAGPDPVIAAAGDVACDPADPGLLANGQSKSSGITCAEMATARLLATGGYSAVLPLGDDQYYCGSLSAYERVYGPSWGQVKSITHPVPGNHEYITAPGTVPATDCNESNNGAAGYFGYFGPAAGRVGQGWYSYNLGAWHLIALNSQCSSIDGCGPTSPEGRWLAADLAAHAHRCTLAYWHVPLFSSGGRAAPDTLPFWNQLYAAGTDVILNGHDHIYERFAPQNPTGALDVAKGITEFIVGTGGANHTDIATVAPNSLIRDTTSFGVLSMTLHATGMDWRFVPATGHFTDSGSLTCHSAI